MNDPAVPAHWQMNDDVIQLREWGTEHAYHLPTDATGEWMVGAEDGCYVQLRDALRFTSRQHARLSRQGGMWTLTDIGSKNGLWIDNYRRASCDLEPGLEIGIGSLRLVAESPRSIELRAFLSRLVGWGEERRMQVDRALRSVREVSAHRAPLYLRGEGNLPAVARSLSHRAFGPDAPFVVSDPRRASINGAKFAPANRPDIASAIEAATGGTLCVWSHSLPAGFESVRAELEQSTCVRLVVCSSTVDDGSPPISVWAPLTLTPLSRRADELDRVIDEYAFDAILVLSAKMTSFTVEDRRWVRRCRPQTLDEIETTVTRVVAYRECGSVESAARKLGISRVALLRWFGRRGRK
jgi:pSer/pThr/pTyr-binding forkhead associated (FHA) protein